MQDRRFVFLIRAIIPRAADDGASGQVRLPFILREVPRVPVQVSLIWYPASVHRRFMHSSSKLAILKGGVVCPETPKAQRPVVLVLRQVKAPMTPFVCSVLSSQWQK
jgi:hypothetical protein